MIKTQTLEIKKGLMKRAIIQTEFSPKVINPDLKSILLLTILFKIKYILDKDLYFHTKFGLKITCFGPECYHLGPNRSKIKKSETSS